MRDNKIFACLRYIRSKTEIEEMELFKAIPSVVAEL